MIIFNKFNPEEKLFAKINKLDNFFNADKTIIVTELDLTNECNNKCTKCIGNNHLKDQLAWKEIRHIAEGLQELNGQGVILSGGGEPLLHPNFIEAVGLLRSHGLKVGINSNCLSLNEDIAVAIARDCEYFRVSLDAGDASMYRQTHGMNEESFGKVINNIKMMARVKDEMGSKLSFGTGFLTSEQTIGQMEAFVRLSKDCGADFAQFRPYQNDLTDVTDQYHDIKRRYESEGFKVLASTQKYSMIGAMERKAYDKCRGMFFSTVITANARMYACLHHRQNDAFLIGDMREGQGKTLSQIWNSHKKWYVYETIDVKHCPLNCRNDSINGTLHNMSMKVAHSEFL